MRWIADERKFKSHSYLYLVADEILNAPWNLEFSMVRVALPILFLVSVPILLPLYIEKDKAIARTHEVELTFVRNFYHEL